jgi:hypothetical protein
MNFTPIPEIVSFTPDRILIRPYFEGFHLDKKRSEAQRTAEKNLQKNKASGLMNRQNTATIRKIIRNWIPTLKLSPTAKNGHKELQPTFITLTLPAQQFHTDRQLHREALNTFITTIKKTHKVINYLWRAERQENGNLHYHIIADRFIGWQLVRKYWNNIMAKMGYIDKYRSNMNEFYKNGFKPRKINQTPEQLKKEIQAYKTGLNENWSNPNSTDIHGLKKINNIEAYVTKYMTKSPLAKEIEALKRKLEGKEANEEEVRSLEDLKKQALEKEKINGKIWGCSRELMGCKDPSIIVDGECISFIEEVKKDKESRVVTEDNFVIIYNKNIPGICRKYQSIKEQLRQHSKDIFYKLYDSYRPPEKEFTITSFQAKEPDFLANHEPLQCDLF